MRQLVRGRLRRALLALALVLASAQAICAQEDAGQAMGRLQEEIAAQGERLDLLLALGKDFPTDCQSCRGNPPYCRW